MPIDTTNPIPGASQPVDPSLHNLKQLSPDDFIKIFLAQMLNQNPMRPADSSGILQQLTNITTIQSSKDMQKTLSTLAQHVDATMGKTQALQASQLIGKTVVVRSDKSALIAGEGLKGCVGLAGLSSPASALAVTIKDATGKTVKTINIDVSKASGLVDFTWDGKDSEGKQLDPGLYNISAAATVNGASKTVPTAGAFKVSSVAFNPDDGGVVMNLDGIESTDLNNVIRIL